MSKSSNTKEDGQESFEDIEQSFQKSLESIVQDKTLAKYRESYEELHNSLITSLEQKKLLMEKCQSLNNEMLSNASKVSKVVLLSQQDQRTINKLRSEFERAWEIVTQCDEKEHRTALIADGLKSEIRRLSDLLDKGVEYAKDDEIDENTIRNEIASIKREIEENGEQIAKIKTQITDFEALTMKHRKYLKSSEETFEFDSKKLNEMLKAIEDNDAFFKLFEKRVDDTSDKCTHLEDIIENNKIEVMGMKDVINEKKDTVESIRLQTDLEYAHLGKTRLNIRKYKKEKREELKKQVQLTDKVKNAKKRTVILQEQIDELHSKIKALNKENKEYADYSEGVNKYKKELAKTIKEAEKTKIDMFDTLSSQKRLNSDALKEVNRSNLHLNIETSKLENLKNELEDEKFLSLIEDNKIRNTEIESESIRMKRQSESSHIGVLEEQAVNYVNERKEARSLKFITDLDTAKKNKEMFELHVKNEKIKENMRKASIDIDNEKEKVGRLAEILSCTLKESEKLNSELDSIDQSIEGSKNIIIDIQKSTIMAHQELLGKRKDIESLTTNINDLKDKMKTLTDADNKILADIEQKILILNQAQNDYNKIIHKETEMEINMLKDKNFKMGVQSKSVREEMNTVKNKLEAYANDYERLVKKVECLKEELNNEVEKERKLKIKSHYYKDLKKECLTLQSQINIEQIRNAACEWEFNNPIRIHRWTIMSILDPDRMNLVTMRLRIIDEISNKSFRLKRLNNDLKNIREDLQKLNQRMLCMPTNARKDMSTVMKDLRLKNQQLEEMSEMVQHGSKAMNEKKVFIDTKKTELHLENENLIKSTRIRREKALTAAPPKLPPIKVKRRDNFFIGGGFCLGNLSVRVPKVPQSARIAKNRLIVSSYTPVEPITPRWKTPRKKALLSPINF